MRLLLASASPRRRELLQSAGFQFGVEPSLVSEELSPGTAPEVLALELALRKALAVASLHRGEDVLVLGADTIVAIGEGTRALLLGKPESPGQAREMLAALSGTRHQVLTGLAAVRARDFESRQDYERTWVLMRPISPQEIDEYVASGEWCDKAGGYAIQESADRFVLGLEQGGYDNVVGLPVQRAGRLLQSLGWSIPPAPAGSPAPLGNS